jgi:hypothetical protein
MPETFKLMKNSLCLSLLFFSTHFLMGAELFEDFKTKGQVKSTAKFEWSYTDQLRPVSGWDGIVPGDGFAYLSIDSDLSNNRLKKGKVVKWPFQMIEVYGIGPGHSLEMKAKNTVIPGVVSFIFTYSEEGNKVDEIDIEIVGDDKGVKGDHPTGRDGWTDIRFNTWANSNLRTLKPHISHKEPIVDTHGKKVSHKDGQFHTYKINWFKDQVDFYIDDVYQTSIRKVVPDSKSTVLIGMRHMSWTGNLDWQGTQTMVIDWLRIKSLINTQAILIEDQKKPKK